jgi:hypothetical protein
MAIKLYEDDKESVLPDSANNVVGETLTRQPKRASIFTPRRLFYAGLFGLLYLTHRTQESLGEDMRLNGIGKQKPGQCAWQPQAIGKGPGMVSRHCLSSTTRSQSSYPPHIRPGFVYSLHFIVMHDRLTNHFPRPLENHFRLSPTSPTLNLCMTIALSYINPFLSVFPILQSGLAYSTSRRTIPN